MPNPVVHQPTLPGLSWRAGTEHFIRVDGGLPGSGFSQLPLSRFEEPWAYPSALAQGIVRRSTTDPLGGAGSVSTFKDVPLTVPHRAVSHSMSSTPSPENGHERPGLLVVLGITLGVFTLISAPAQMFVGMLLGALIREMINAFH